LGLLLAFYHRPHLYCWFKYGSLNYAVCEFRE
jgi:hypothetical protein